MDISSSTSAPQESTNDSIKKAIEVEEQQVLKIIEAANEQTKQVAAQKTGIGSNINITG